ncbi:hypothetical protein SAMN05421805_103147 [Saccharopolyspora antimicrobica]|uniref:Uncharacterized protein n=1 Tax=Saccharopolyspora antimicrobica TaxID=455193 RepID=A0A1I4WY94_9PSEU|nr:hypothetical protein [Saccharopolyspora antimicrobica]RKT84221.1 hypothetical protein ATL45_2531 [Saccharopolyspora antimicrobica]SFN18818.1 hypothetical protein SAMN05421805_103147 [Saccharopolyspora antimicrobica]
MADPDNDAQVLDLVERIAAALNRDEGCQVLVVRLARRAGWTQARRLVLSRVHRDGRVASVGAA